MRAATADMERATSSDSEITRAGFHACRRLEFVKRHHRPGTHRGDAALDAEIGQHRFQHAGIFFQRLVGQGVVVLDRRGLGQKVQRRQLIFAIGQIERRLLAPLGRHGARAGLLALDAAFAPLGQPGRGERLRLHRDDASSSLFQVIGAFFVVVIFMIVFVIFVT